MRGIIEKKDKPQKRIYSFQELADFDKEIKPYKIEGELDGRKIMYFSVEGEFSYLQNLGIVKTYSGEKITAQMKSLSSLPEYKIIDTKGYEEIENKICQFFNQKAKKDFIFQQSIDYYERNL